MSQLSNKKSRVASVEFWRFLFTVLVCLYHLEIYFTTGKVFPSGTSAVEFFFVLGGFLAAMSARNFFARRPEEERSLSSREASRLAALFVWKKVKAIFPVLLITLILHLLFNGGGYQYKNALDAALHMEWELLFMVGTGFGYNGMTTPIVPLWFLTALFAAGYVYTYFLYRKYDFTLFLAPILGVLLVSYFTLKSSLVLDFNVSMDFLTAGMVKGFGEMALGIALFRLWDHLSGIRRGKVWHLVLTLLMLFAVWCYFALTLNQNLGPDNFRRIVYIMIIILLSFLNEDEITRLLNGKVSRWLGHISLPMYVSHFTLCTLYFWFVGQMKMRNPLSGFWRDMGGSTGWTSTACTWKDRVLYIIMVMLCSVIMLGLTALVKKLIAKLRGKSADA